MAQGKKTTPEMIYKVMNSWAVTDNCAETSRECGVPESTVRKIVDDNKDKPEFVELCAQKRKLFAERATEIIDKGLRLLARRMETALEHEGELELLLDEIARTSTDEIPQKTKQALIQKIKALELQRLGEITTAIGTLYDKRALAQGESTSQTRIEIQLPKEAEDYAG